MSGELMDRMTQNADGAADRSELRYSISSTRFPNSAVKEPIINRSSSTRYVTIRYCPVTEF